MKAVTFVAVLALVAVAAGCANTQMVWGPYGQVSGGDNIDQSWTLGLWATFYPTGGIPGMPAVPSNQNVNLNVNNSNQNSNQNSNDNSNVNGGSILHQVVNVSDGHCGNCHSHGHHYHCRGDDD